MDYVYSINDNTIPYVINSGLGPQGSSGATWYTGTGAPASGLGVNNDLYLDTDTNEIYQKASDTWSSIGNIQGDTGDKGDKGDTGENGASVLLGSGVPSDGLGSNGDVYLNEDNGDIYDKVAGTWGASSGNFAATSVSALSDVVITSVGAGEILKYDGANYINNTLAEAGIAASGHTHVATDITDFDAEVSNNTNVAANTTHISSDGTDHANVVLNDSHRIATNDPHSTVSNIAYNATSWDSVTGQAASKNAIRDKVILIDAAVALNTTHKSSNGSDHSYINQDVTTTGTPTFGNTTVNGTITVTGTVDGRDVAADGSKLDGIEAAADVTDATNVNAAGAVMNSDTSTSAMSFVVDEDTMSSNSATKVPTQQSVKAYVDSSGGDPNVTLAASVVADNAVIRGNGGVRGVQDSGVIIDDSDNVSGINSLKLDAIAGVAHAAGNLFYDIAKDALTFHNSEADVSLQIGEEIWIQVTNNSGVLIPNGAVVYITGAVAGRSEITMAQANLPNTADKTIGFATHAIENGTDGIVTTIGKVNDVNTDGMTAGDSLYLSPTVLGGYTNVRPLTPDYVIRLGSVLTPHISAGNLYVNVTGNIEDTLLHAFDGNLLESFDFTIAATGGVITGSLEQNGGGNVTMNFSDGFTVLDTTPAKTIVLTGGSATVPQEQFVYIPISTKVLTVSTSAWPSTEHVKVANVNLLDATSTESIGPLSNRNWNDHVANGGNGHISHLNERIRKEHAVWESGAGLTVDIQTGASPDDFFLSNSSGVVFQMHEQTFPALDMETGDELLIVNHDTTPYTAVTNLNTTLTDSLGDSLSGKYYSLVIWGMANQTGEASHLMCNLPSGSYNGSTAALVDADRYSNYSIPAEFRGIGFLIGRVTIKHGSGGGGTFVQQGTTEDLRGKLPDVTAGGTASGVVTEFDDGQIHIFDTADNTKIIDFEAANITTGTTRTITMADADVDLANVATAAAVMVDNTLVKGDGGAKGVQDSGIIVSDTDDLSAIRNISYTGTPDGDGNALSDGATITPNCDLGDMMIVTLAGNRTLALPTNIKTYSTWQILVTQDATGSRTLDTTAYKSVGGVDPVLTTTANAIDILTFSCFSNTSSVYIVGANDFK